MKKLLCILLAMSLLLIACAPAAEAPAAEAPAAAPAAPAAPAGEAGVLPADGPEYNFNIGTSATSVSVVGQTAQYLADIVTERSGGKITLTAYPDSQLGSDTELIEGVQMGTITMVIGTTAPQVSFVPGLALFDIPNVYSDISVAQKVLADFAPEMLPAFDGTGLYPCTMFPTVFRWMSCSKEIRKVEDFNGIKIRTMENPYHMNYWNGLGATATPLAFSELYIGLQQGLVDAQENPLDIFMSSKFNEQQAYVINTKHIAFIATILMNQEQWNEMPAEYQAFMSECFAEASAWATENASKLEAENIEKIKATGVEVIELDDAVIAEMVEISQPIYDAVREAVGTELVDAYLAAIEANS